MTTKAASAELQTIYRSALEALNAGRFEDGVVLLEKLVAAGPPNGDVLNNLGTAHWKCGRLNKAEECYAQAVRLSPDNPIAQNNYGGLLMELSRIDAAEQHIRRAHQLKPDHPSIANHLGLIQCRRGELADAEKSFQRAIRMRPNWPDAHTNLGNVYRDMKRIAEAEACYRHSLRLDPNNANAWRDLGALLFTTLRNAEAEQALRKALSLRPQSEVSWNLLLQLLEVTNRTEEAAAALVQAKALYPDSAPVATIEARLLRRQGKIAEAIAEMERILPKIKGVQDDVLFLFELGQLYDRAGRTDEAFATFSRGKALQGERADARAIDKTFFTALAARTKETLNPAFVGALPPPVAETEPSPVFLVGFPRSGTTLLDQILSSHPEVRVNEEKPGVAAMGEYFCRQFGTKLKPGEAPRSRADIWGDTAYPRDLLKLSPDDIAAMRRAFWTGHGFQSRPPERIFVDRLPVNLLHGALLHTVFPKAKFILALRHPCDCVLSTFMQAFGMHSATARFLDLSDSATFYDELFSVWEHTRKLFPLEVHTIHYEDVVADFRPTVEALLRFLDLPWNDAVLEFDKTAQSRERINTASYNQVTQKIYTRAAGRWLRYKKHLTPVLDILAPHAARYGYSMRTDE